MGFRGSDRVLAHLSRMYIGFWLGLPFSLDLDHEWCIHRTFGHKGTILDKTGILNVDWIPKSPFVLIEINRDGMLGQEFGAKYKKICFNVFSEYKRNRLGGKSFCKQEMLVEFGD